MREEQLKDVWTSVSVYDNLENVLSALAAFS